MTKAQTIALLGKLNVEAGNCRALENILVALIQLCGQCCYPLTGWFSRRDRRNHLNRDIECATSRKALSQLVRLTKSAVEACSWRDEFHVTSLLVEDMLPKSKTRNPESTAKMLATKAAKAQAQQDALDSRISAYKEAA